MKIKKITSVILFLIIGLYFVFASESAISTIINSNIQNVRQVGYELCKIYIKKDKSYVETLLYYAWGIKPEENIAKNLMKDRYLLSEIFSGKGSDDPVVKELQEGCFDFLTEEFFLHTKEFLEMNLDENFLKKLNCWPAEKIEEKKSKEPEFDPYSLNIQACNMSQLSLLDDFGKLAEKNANATIFQYKLMKLLGLTDRIQEFKQKIEDLKREYGLIDVDDIEETEL